MVFIVYLPHGAVHVRRACRLKSHFVPSTLANVANPRAMLAGLRATASRSQHDVVEGRRSRSPHGRTADGERAHELRAFEVEQRADEGRAHALLASEVEQRADERRAHAFRALEVEQTAVGARMHRRRSTLYSHSEVSSAWC